MPLNHMFAMYYSSAQRKAINSELEAQRNECKVRNLSPQAFKFYMEQHIENVIKSCEERKNR